MPVPTSISDLNATAINNSPAGSDAIGTSLDDYLRAHAAIIKQVSTNGAFVAGTRIPFAQSAAPTGWTQDVSDNADNRMLRVIKTAGGSVAGSHSPILMDVVPSHTHSVSVNATDTNHTHNFDTGSSGGHDHAYAMRMGSYTPQTTGVAAGSATADESPSSRLWQTNNGSHSHSGATGWMNHNTTHSHTGSATANGSAANWTPRYIDLIICSKDA